MDVDTASTLVMVVAPILLLLEGLVVLVVWGVVGGGIPSPIRRARTAGRAGVGGAAVGTWLLASTVTALVGWMVSFIAIHALLFQFGTGAAWAGIAASMVFMAAVPIFWAIVIDRGARHR